MYIYIYCRSFPLWISSGNAAKSTDFNEPNQQSMKDLCLIYNWKSIITDKTCCKNPYCIDLKMVNMPKSF